MTLTAGNGPQEPVDTPESLEQGSCGGCCGVSFGDAHGLSVQADVLAYPKTVAEVEAQSLQVTVTVRAVMCGQRHDSSFQTLHGCAGQVLDLFHQHRIAAESVRLLSACCGRSGGSAWSRASATAKTRRTRAGARAHCSTGSSGLMPASSGPRGRCTDADGGPGRFQGDARSSAQGSMTAIPQCSKSAPLRVATAASRARAIAAIWQSASRIGRPAERREAAITA